MKERRDNLWKIIDTNSNVKVVVAFLYQNTEAEVDPNIQKNEVIRRLALRKYAKVLLRAKSVLSTKSSLELRIVDGNKEDRRRFGNVFGIFKLNDGVDEASCFAQQALRDKAASHLVMFNGAEVTRHRRILETSIGRAWDAETSLLRLAALILKHNGHEEGNGAINTEELTAIKDMYDVQVITSRPDYDPRTLQFLGRGAFGEVYKVTDKSGKSYAIKMLKELETSDIRALEKFKRETESLSKVCHPNIVKLEEVMREGHRLCIKLEFVDGCDLRHIIEPKDGQPSPQSKEFVLDAAKQIGAALEYLHQRELIHGDIKADNVMVTRDRKTFKLADFGLARNAPKDVTQTRTREGSMRYMAPEVATETRSGKARYSNKADVYSYGLMMIEVISGHYIFEEYMDPKVIVSKKVKGTIDPRIPVDCEDNHGAIMVQVLSGCLKYQTRSRLAMKDVIQMLDGKEDALKHTKGVQLLCLGTGKGVTAAVYGEASSSMVILHDGKPILLVDMGLGIIKAYQSALGDTFPKDIFITHNHSDHSGELPLGGYIAVQSLRQNNLPFKLNILCGPEVVPKLRDHRMDELYSALPKEQLSKFVEWTSCPAGDKIYLNEERTMYLITHRSQHAETCYGFNLYIEDKNILGFSADSGFNQAVYDKTFAASTVVVDARTGSTKEHASFDEVIEFGAKLQSKPHHVYITGYGRQDEWPEDKDMATVLPLTPGELYTLWPLQV
ncbi:uncharacterized protein [Amphiura filiformis]|uniref:uncharacterized protein n=1 Tax=Amphiura filiformis TaxID=82378 RepID=UPI003B2169C8